MQTVPLAVAAQKAGVSWWQARERLLRGEWKGELKDGRWVVEVASIRETAAA